MKHEHLHCTCEKDSSDWRHGLHTREEAPESDSSLLRLRRQRGQQIGQRRHAGIEAAPGRAQRLVRFEHDREFRDIKAADKDQGAGAETCGPDRGMREGVTREQLEDVLRARFPGLEI